MCTRAVFARQGIHTHSSHDLITVFLAACESGISRFCCLLACVLSPVPDKGVEQMRTCRRDSERNPKRPFTEKPERSGSSSLNQDMPDHPDPCRVHGTYTSHATTTAAWIQQFIRPFIVAPCCVWSAQLRDRSMGYLRQLVNTCHCRNLILWAVTCRLSQVRPHVFQKPQLWEVSFWALLECRNVCC